MTKTVFLTVSTLALAIVLLVALLPVNNSAPDRLAGVTHPPDQAEFVRAYALGRTYEQAGRLADAQAQYAEAALASQPEIAAAARQSVQRVAAKQQSWRRALKSQLDSALGWLGQALLAAMLLIVTVAAIWLLANGARRGLARFAAGTGYQLLPFVDLTGGLAGQAHLAFYATLIDTQQLYRQAEQTLLTQVAAGTFPVLGLLPAGPGGSGAEALQVVDKVSVAGLGLKVAPLFNIIQQFFTVKERAIAGQVYQHGGQVQLHLEIRRSRDQTLEKSTPWVLTGAAAQSPAEQLETLAEQAAYRFLLAHSQAFGTHAWRGLQYFSRGLQARQAFSEQPDPALIRQAMAHFQEAIAADADHLAAHFALGTVYNSLGRYEAAEAVFRRLQTEPELKLPATYNLGVSLFHQFGGRWSRAAAYEQFEKILRTIDRRAENESSRLLLALTHAQMAMLAAFEIKEQEQDWVMDPAKGRMELVLSYNQQAEKLAQSLSEPARRVVEGARLHALGQAHLHQGSPEQGREFLEQSLAVRPTYALTCISMAHSYDRKTDEHIYWLQQALKINPALEYGYLQLGIAHDIRRKAAQDEATAETERTLARQAFEKAAGYADAHNALGEYLIQDGEVKAGLNEFRTATQLNRRHELAWSNRVYRTLQAIERGLLADSEKNLQDVMQWGQHYLTLVAGTGFEWRAYDLIGWVFLLQGRLADAAAALQHSIALPYGNRQLQNRYRLALIYRQRGELQQACAELAAGLPHGKSQTSIYRQARSLAHQLDCEVH